MYENADALPEELFDKDGNRVFIRGYLLSARQETAQAMSRMQAKQLLNQTVIWAVELAGQEFVNEWVKALYRVRIEEKP